MARRPPRIRRPAGRDGRHARRHPRRGRHAAPSRAGALAPHRRRRVGEVRGHEPHRLLQGPRHDDGRDARPSSTARRSSSAPRPATRRRRPRPTPRTPASRPPCSCPRARSRWASSARPSRTTPSSSRSRATSTTASRSRASSPTNYPVHLVNSVNHDRIEGQKTAAYEVVEVLGDAPDFHFIPVGNAGNYTAYSRGYREDIAAGNATRCRACSASRPRARAPLVRGEIVQAPRDHRQRDPHRQPGLVGARPRGARRDRRLLRRDRRRQDPRGAAHPLGRGRHLRRARLGDQRRRPPRARRGRRRARRARGSCSPSPATA